MLHLKKLQRILSLLLAVALIAGLMLTGVGSIALADEAFPAGEIRTQTIVSETPDKVNNFDVTLRIYGKTEAAAGKDVILLLDQSGSLTAAQLQEIKTAATEFVNSVLKDSSSTERIAIVTFSTNANIKNNFTGFSGKQELLNTINGMRADGSTHTQGALHKAIELLGQADAKKDTAVILLSDGKPECAYPVLAKFQNAQTPMPYEENGVLNIGMTDYYEQARTMKREYWNFTGSYGGFSFYAKSKSGVGIITAAVSPINAALSESDELNKYCSNVYTIAYNLRDSDSISILADIATSSDKAFKTGSSSVSAILKQISADISAKPILKDGKILNVVAKNFTITNVQTVGSTSTLTEGKLTWTTDVLNTPTAGVAGLKYSGNDIVYSELNFHLAPTDDVLVGNTPNAEGKYNLLAVDPLVMNYKDVGDAAATLDFGNAYVSLVRTPVPEINPIKAGDTTISGTGKPGATITVKLPNNELHYATVDKDGKWTVPVPDSYTLKENDNVSAEAKLGDELKSQTASGTVSGAASDKDKYEPTGKEQTVELNGTPDAKNSIANAAELPAGTSYEYKTAVDTSTVGDKPAVVVVNYPDGTKDEVDVIVKVVDSRSDKDKYEPTGKEYSSVCSRTAHAPPIGQPQTPTQM